MNCPAVIRIVKAIKSALLLAMFDVEKISMFRKPYSLITVVSIITAITSTDTVISATLVLKFPNTL
jgi:hypothetical protein